MVSQNIPIKYLLSSPSVNFLLPLWSPRSPPSSQIRTVYKPWLLTAEQSHIFMAILLHSKLFFLLLVLCLFNSQTNERIQMGRMDEFFIPLTRHNDMHLVVINIKRHFLKITHLLKITSLSYSKEVFHSTSSIDWLKCSLYLIC